MTEQFPDYRAHEFFMWMQYVAEKSNGTITLQYDVDAAGVASVTCEWSPQPHLAEYAHTDAELFRANVFVPRAEERGVTQIKTLKQGPDSFIYQAQWGDVQLDDSAQDDTEEF